MNASSFEMVKKTEFLPVELRLIYINCGVYNELLGETEVKVDVEIEGDIHEAMNFQNKQQNENNNDNESSQENNDDEEENEEEEFKVGVFLQRW